jgi:WD40 repeat protein
MRILSTGEGKVHDLAFWPGGGVLATTHPFTTHPVRLWDLATGEVWRSPAGKARPAQGLAFSPDGKLLAGGGEASKRSRYGVEMWRVAEDGRSLTAAGFRAWPSGKGAPILPWWIDTLAFSADGGLLVAVCETSALGSLAIWDVRSGRAVEYPWRPHHEFRSFAIAPDGQTLVTAALGSRVKVWTLSVRQVNMPVHVFGVKGRAHRLAFAPDGRTLAVSAGKSVFLWDVPGWKLRHSLAASDRRVQALAFSPDGRTLATGAEDRRVRFWDPADGRLKAEYFFDVGPVKALAFAPDGLSLAAGGGSQKVALVDVDG